MRTRNVDSEMYWDSSACASLGTIPHETVRPFVRMLEKASDEAYQVLLDEEDSGKRKEAILGLYAIDRILDKIESMGANPFKDDGGNIKEHQSYSFVHDNMTAPAGLLEIGIIDPVEYEDCLGAFENNDQYNPYAETIVQL